MTCLSRGSLGGLRTPDAPQQTTPSFDHLVGAGKQRWRHSQSEGLRSLEIDHQLELSRLLHWKISGLGAPEDFVDVAGGTPKEVSETCPIGHEPAGCHEFSKPIKGRQLLLGREVYNELTIIDGERVLDRNQRIAALSSRRFEYAIEVVRAPYL